MGKLTGWGNKPLLKLMEVGRPMYLLYLLVSTCRKFTFVLVLCFITSCIVSTNTKYFVICQCKVEDMKVLFLSYHLSICVSLV